MRTPYGIALAMLLATTVSFAGLEGPYSELRTAWFGTTTTTPPIVTTSAPDSISQSSARLNGLVNPNGFSTTAYFQWGLTQLYGSTVDSASIGSGATDVARHKVITGLLPLTMYHYRMVGSSGQGTTNGGDRTFTTLPLAPVVLLLSTDSITFNSARVSGTVLPQGAATNAHFEYGVDGSPFSISSTVTGMGNGLTPVTISATLTGLQPGTDYHLRLSGVNGGGTSLTVDVPFRTLNTPPAVLTNSATDIGKSSAILHAEALTSELPGTAWFQFGEGLSYGDSTPVVTVDSGATLNYSSGLTGLLPGHTYHFRSVAVSAAGIEFGADRYLTTLTSGREYLPDSKTALLLHFNESDHTLLQDYSFNDEKISVTGTVPYGLVFGNGRVFVADVDGLEIPPDSSLDFHDSDFTIEAWIQQGLASAKDFDLIKRGSPSSNSESYRLTVTREGAIELILNGTGSPGGEFVASTFNRPLNDSYTHHVAAVVSTSSHFVRLYVDGNLQNIDTSGTFPAALYSGSDKVQVGTPLIGSSAGRTVYGSAPFVILDELRISRKARTRSELHVGGAIAGTVFNDANANSRFDNWESGLSGWKIVLFSASATGHTYAVDSTVSGSDGSYLFDGLDAGIYYTKEALQNGWIRTYPRGSQLHRIPVTSLSLSDDENYGNVFGCRYIGNPGGAWSNPANWSCGHAPTVDDPIVIPNDTTVSIDGLPGDSINALRIGTGGRLSFGHIAQKLKIRGTVQIDSGGTLQLPATDDGTGINCYGDWLNFGSFDPGNSTVIFSGSDPKTISYSYGSSAAAAKAHRRSVNAGPGNQFYNLQIDGDSTSTDGNITIQNTLTLNANLDAQPADTIFVVSDSSSAVAGTGKVSTGTVSRAVRNGALGSYRFESSYSTVQFISSPSYPGTLSETPSPDTLPRSWGLYWEPVPGVVNLTDHTVTADNVNHFSKWIVGKPGGMMKPSTIPHVNAVETFQTGFDTNSAVRRLYSINVDANNGSFNARVALRYEPSEIGGVLNESGLQLFRGPIAIDSVQAGWNMISVPVTPDNSAPAAVFPSASSQAFAYSNTYTASGSLVAGMGYWLKFPAGRLDSVMGNDFEQLTIPVNQGWNMIGGLSYQTTTASISSDDGVTIGTVYGYNHGYAGTTVIKPFRGYWIKASAAGHLTLISPVSSAAPKPADPRDQAVASMASLTVTDAAGSAQTLYVGTADAEVIERLEMPPPPPAGVFDARFEGNSIAAISTDERPAVKRLLMKDAAYPLNISWNNTKTAAGELLLSNGRALSMAGRGSAMIASPEISIAVRALASSATTGALPKQFALYQNYPNPFNPSTMIRFDLAQDATVNLTVYNVLGQAVASVLDGKPVAAGSHTVSFDASRLGSGVYFFTIRAGSFSASRKMVLIR